MIKFENTEVVGWEAAIRGMRNPMNSWDRSDSREILQNEDDVALRYEPIRKYQIGNNDHNLMMKLCNAGIDHRKFMRMIVVYVDITAPLYWWKEADTYKVGTVANSCSTMHKIVDKEFTLEDFSHEHLIENSIYLLKDIISALNEFRDLYINFGRYYSKGIVSSEIITKKDVWWQMIQLLPSSYNQKRTVMMNYEVLANIYKSRKNHKLDEWSVEFMEWIKSLPYSELITGKETENTVNLKGE